MDRCSGHSGWRGGRAMKQPDRFWAVPGVADGWTSDVGRVSEERTG